MEGKEKAVVRRDITDRCMAAIQEDCALNKLNAALLNEVKQSTVLHYDFNKGELMTTVSDYAKRIMNEIKERKIKIMEYYGIENYRDGS